MNVKIFLAWRFFRSKRKDRFVSIIGWLTLIGIVLGVATLIIVMSVMNGFRNEILRKVISVSGDVIVYPQTPSELKTVQDIVHNQKSVKGVWAYTQGEALVVVDNQAYGVQVRGIESGYFQRNTKAHEALKKGNASKLVLGYRFVQNTGVKIGQDVIFISPHFSGTFLGSLPEMTTFQLTGITRFGMYQYDSSLAFIPLKQALPFFHRTHPDGLAVFLYDPMEAEVVAGQLTKLPGVRFAEPWGKANQAFFGALATEKNVMFIILSLIVIVAAFNIISGQILYVRDQIHNIAVLRALGVSWQSVLQIFFISGCMTGILGTFIGGIIGILGSYYLTSIVTAIEHVTGLHLIYPEVYYLSTLPTELYWSDVLYVIVVALILVFVAALYPAYRASRIDPSKVLRV